MDRILVGVGNLSWDASERRTDRYGSVRLNVREGVPFLVDPQILELEGRKGSLVAKVIEPVKSPHMGDLFRGLLPSTPDLNEEVIFGEGEFFVERKGAAPWELGQHERMDQEAWDTMLQSLQGAGVKITIPVREPTGEPVYDIIGLKPEIARDTDWLDPRAFYRTHLSKVELYFVPKEI